MQLARHKLCYWKDTIYATGKTQLMLLARYNLYNWQDTTYATGKAQLMILARHNFWNWQDTREKWHDRKETQLSQPYTHSFHNEIYKTSMTKQTLLVCIKGVADTRQQLQLAQHNRHNGQTWHDTKDRVEEALNNIQSKQKTTHTTCTTLSKVCKSNLFDGFCCFLPLVLIFNKLAITANLINTGESHSQE